MNNVLQEKPMVINCTLEHPPAGSRYGPSIRKIFTLECIVSGYGSVTINGREFPTGPGDCYVLLPGDAVSHTTDAETPRVNYWLSLRGLSLDRHFKALGISSETPFIPKAACPEIFAWVKHMTENWNGTDIASDLRQTACIYGILGAMYQGNSLRQTDVLIDKAIDLMERLYSQQINVPYIAGHVGLTRTYFSELFKRETGKTPHQYLTSLRIQKACYFLVHEPKRSMSDVAELVGLEPQSFFRLFKKEMKTTPLAYKKKFQEEQGHRYIPGSCDGK